MRKTWLGGTFKRLQGHACLSWQIVLAIKWSINSASFILTQQHKMGSTLPTERGSPQWSHQTLRPHEFVRKVIVALQNNSEFFFSVQQALTEKHQQFSVLDMEIWNHPRVSSKGKPAEGSTVFTFPYWQPHPVVLGSTSFQSHHLWKYLSGKHYTKTSYCEIVFETEGKKRKYSTLYIFFFTSHEFF